MRIKFKKDKLNKLLVTNTISSSLKNSFIAEKRLEEILKENE
jgi:hypothetical protein